MFSGLDDLVNVLHLAKSWDVCSGLQRCPQAACLRNFNQLLHDLRMDPVKSLAEPAPLSTRGV